MITMNMTNNMWVNYGKLPIMMQNDIGIIFNIFINFNIFNVINVIIFINHLYHCHYPFVSDPLTAHKDRWSNLQRGFESGVLSWTPLQMCSKLSLMAPSFSFLAYPSHLKDNRWSAPATLYPACFQTGKALKQRWPAAQVKSRYRVQGMGMGW